MMSANARSFPIVKISWILVAQRTLEQFTQVRNTAHTQTQAHNKNTCNELKFKYLLTGGVFHIGYEVKVGLMFDIH